MLEHTFRQGKCTKCGLTYFDLWSCKDAEMDRLKEKLALAAGVAVRVTASIEKDADALIAREGDVALRSKNAFAPHHAALDQRMRELNSLEDALKIMENADPLEDSGDSSGKKESDTMTADEFDAKCKELCQYCRDGMAMRQREDTREYVHEGVVAIPGTLGKRMSHTVCLASDFRNDNKDHVVG